jgi:hypothetical protein
MKNLILISFLSIASLFVKAQSTPSGALKIYFHSAQISSRDSSNNDKSAWSAYQATNARFYIYMNGKSYSQVVAYFSPKDGFTVPTNFYVYDQKQVLENNGLSYYLYVYYASESGSKTYDHTEYFKVKDQITENISSLQLFGYQNSTVWAWILDAVQKY